MSLFKNNNADLLDDAVSQVAGEPIDPRQIEEAAARVWAKLSQGVPLEGSVSTAASGPAAFAAISDTPAAPAAGGLTGGLNNCDDFQSSIPAYLRGELSPARALLVEDHTRNCVPCRRALRDAREGHQETVAARRPAARVVLSGNKPRNRAIWMSLAAVLAVALGFGLFILAQDMLAGGAKMARIESVEGTLYRVAGDTSRPVGAGDSVAEGEEIRTAKGSTALVRMADGSLIEMSERAGFSLDADHKGNTIQLERGRIIVRAAKQRSRHLYVATRDALVSVTGTIFAVNSGTKGSRVSVLQGEVRVQQGAKDALLHPGDQVTTHASVERVALKDEVAWSRNAKEYDQLLAELTALGKDIDARVARPGLRYSTKLLDLAPAGTTVWIALPNLTKSLSQTQQILDQRISESPSLAQWWTEILRSTDNEQKFHDMIAKLGDLGANLGDEVAVAMNVGGENGDHHGSPVLLAEVTNEASFRATVAAEIAAFNSSSGKTAIQIVDDPAGAPEGQALLLYIHNGVLVASPSGAELRTVAALMAGGANPFTATPFRTRIAQDYHDGAGWLFAADLHTLVAAGEADKPAESRQMAEKLGILDVDQFIIDRRESDGRAETRAALTFTQTRRGVASWLAAPAPMGRPELLLAGCKLRGRFRRKEPGEHPRRAGERESEAGAGAGRRAGEARLRSAGRPRGAPRRRARDGGRRPAAADPLLEDGDRGLRPRSPAGDLREGGQPDECRADPEWEAGGAAHHRDLRRPDVPFDRHGRRLEPDHLPVRGRLPGGRPQPRPDRAGDPAPQLRSDPRHHREVPRPPGPGRPGQRLGADLHQHRADRAVGLGADPERRR